MKDIETDAALERIGAKISETEALGLGKLIAAQPTMEQRLAALEKSDQVERLLGDLKSRLNAETNGNGTVNSRQLPPAGEIEGPIR
jgi:hypothetical protein